MPLVLSAHLFHAARQALAVDMLKLFCPRLNKPINAIRELFYQPPHLGLGTTQQTCVSPDLSASR